VRARRSARGLTLKALGARAEVSERFLVQLEGGSGNISVARLLDVANALGTTPAELLAEAAHEEPPPFSGVLALLGLRGAGKSTIGERAAHKLGVPFVELDALVARDAGMTLSTIFELHGEAYYRRAERETLRKFLAETPRAILATGGSLVSASDTFTLLRDHAMTIWLKADAKDHWDRVVAQGDGRPMKDRPAAMTELKNLLKARKPLYSLADHVIDTSGLTLDDGVDRLVELARGKRKRRREG
jgi:XRE family aerobic/anaerobic benzoate catabolism transcriptional regulator